MHRPAGRRHLNDDGRAGRERHAVMEEGPRDDGPYLPNQNRMLWQMSPHKLHRLWKRDAILCNHLLCQPSQRCQVTHNFLLRRNEHVEEHVFVLVDQPDLGNVAVVVARARCDTLNVNAKVDGRKRHWHPRKHPPRSGYGHGTWDHRGCLCVARCGCRSEGRGCDRLGDRRVLGCLTHTLIGHCCGSRRRIHPGRKQWAPGCACKVSRKNSFRSG